MLTKREILNSYKGKELRICITDRGTQVISMPPNEGNYQIITNIGDELFEVENYNRGQKVPSKINYYSLDHIVLIEKL